MVVWRIASDTPDFTADDLTGAGANKTGGRWNRPGTPMLYCSTSISLCVLETMVHLNAGGLPLNRYLVQVEIPDEVWMRRESMSETNAPVGWDAIPSGKVSLDLGDAWAASARSALLELPSAIVPLERNVLINPAHPDSKGIIARKLRKWTYDPRMLMASVSAS